MIDYTTFLASKHVSAAPSGFEVEAGELNPHMFKFQADICKWALGLGKAALFLNVGLGKTLIQLTWAQQVHQHRGGKVLILTPLAVADQTVREGVKFGIAVKHVSGPDEIGDAPIVVTNYDRAHLFDAVQFVGIVLDESGLLKHYSKTFFALVEKFEQTPYKLCCTATPSPNDWVELGNHAMFLGVMHFKDMLARWFVGEGDIARKARLKHHAAADFWRWLTSWAVCISKPSDLGTEYDMPGYELPQMHVHEYRLAAPQASIDRAQSKGQLLPDGSTSATQFHTVKRESLLSRADQQIEIVASIPQTDPVILWCYTDYEADELKKRFPGVIEVRGSQTAKRKEELLRAFTEGKERMIITKPQLAGMGLNWQHCNQASYIGVDFSFETTFQSMGRIRRFGQERETHFHITYTDTEADILQILKRKEMAFAEMQAEMKAAIQEYGLFREEQVSGFRSATGTIPMILPDWLVERSA
jgi:hypothetical protein